MFDIAIKSKRIICAAEQKEGIVIIKGGVIIDIINSLDTFDERVVDVNDNVVMAGVVDPHVHINEPGRTNWEGFDTATKAALAGGVTSVVDMPLNSSPVTTTVKALNEKVSATKGKLHTNCGFWGGVVPGNENEIQPLIDNGVLGFKAFLTHSGIDEFPNVTEADLRKIMPIIARSGLPLLVHCELTHHQSTAEAGSQKSAGDPRSYQNYLHSRPRSWEDNAIALMIRLCREFNCRVHIVHLSSSNSIPQIAQAKQEGLPLTVETAQHYLFFDDQIQDGQTQFKCAPPIRENENREKLWQALKDGTIDFVASDHSPCPPEMKCPGTGDFFTAWGGIASLQFVLPVLWTAAFCRGCTINDVSRWLSQHPAGFAGLSKKGKIEKGFDADIVVWEPGTSYQLLPETILHRHKITPYLMQELMGSVEQTYLAGEKVFDTGKFLHLNKGKILTSVSV